MPHDFDTFVERRSSGCVKWNYFDHDVLPMWVADMDFKAPDAIIKALKERSEHGVFGYHMDIPGLREVIVERLASHHNLIVQEDQLAFMPGLVMGLNFVSRLFGGPDEAVLTQTPIYPPFLGAPKNQNCPLHTAPLAVTRDGSRIRYELDLDALEAAVTPQTRLFLLCNPHNPGGRVWTRGELEQIAEFCLRHDLIVVSDEIHCDLVYPEYQHISIASLSPEVAARTITLLAPSKTFNVPGLGASFAVVQDPEMLKTLRDWVFSNGAGVNIMGYTAMLAAYSDGQEWLDNVLPYLQVNRDVVIDYVDENMPNILTTRPEGTYLMWMDCRALNLPVGKSAQQFFLEKGRVALNEGSAFGTGGEGFVRLNFATTRDTVLEGLRRLKTAYDLLKV